VVSSPPWRATPPSSPPYSRVKPCMPTFPKERSFPRPRNTTPPPFQATCPPPRKRPLSWAFAHPGRTRPLPSKRSRSTCRDDSGLSHYSFRPRKTFPFPCKENDLFSHVRPVAGWIILSHFFSSLAGLSIELMMFPPFFGGRPGVTSSPSPQAPTPPVYSFSPRRDSCFT